MRTSDICDPSVQVLTEALTVALKGTEEEVQVHHLLGTVLQQQKKYDAAISEFRAALGWCRACATRCSLGWTSPFAGQQGRGQRYLQKFVDGAGAEAPAHYVKAARDKLSSRPRDSERFMDTAPAASQQRLN